jgi:uncharacterized membrane protein
MEKRPVSLTVIAILLIIFGLFGLYSAATLPSNAMAVKMLANSPVPLIFNQLWTVLGSIVGFACAYGILKGLPWSRVLYLAWGIVALAVGLYISPIKYILVFSLVLLVIVCAFLWTNAANDWFQARGLMLTREGRRG